METLIAVGIGGGLGAMARYVVNAAMTHSLGSGFPYGIMLINVLGSVAMGVLIGLFALRIDVPATARIFLTTGMLGGFTTFSTFSLDSVMLIQRGAYGFALLYIGGSLLLSIGGLMAGMAGMRLWLT